MNIEPIKPNLPEYRTSRDHAKGGYSITQLEGMLKDRDNQPLFRENADLSCAYYDGHGQMTEDQRREAEQEGLEPRSINLIGRVINGVLGQEAKARTDVKVEGDDDETTDLCDVLNPQLKEAQRETFADMAVSNGYASQVKAGFGFVEVARNQDPLDYAYRVADVHRNEIHWDWRAKDYLLRDARWLTRSRWQDLDELEATMPEHEEVLRRVSNGWNGFIFEDLEDTEMASRLRLSYERENSFRVSRTEWFEQDRRRIKMYEVWYKVPATAVVLHLGPTRRVLFDETNAVHVQAVARGLVRISKAVTRQVRMALYAGPHRLLDVGTARRQFPYIPFFAFRDDEDLTPYGLIEGMRAPQDEYNERRMRIQWMLKAKQITLDADALDQTFNTFKDLANEAMRPDMLLVLNPNRKNPNSSVRIANDLSLQAEQVNVMNDAKVLIQDVPGVYSTQLGNAPSGVTSGVANSLLIEQGAVAMGELNDNYRNSRRAVYEALLELIVEDHLAENLRVSVGRGSSKRVVVLNSFDPQTGQMVNQMRDAPVRIGLGEAPSTPAFRMQQQQQVGNIIQALAGVPQAVAVLAPTFIEATDLPNRMELADDLRRATGVPTAGDREAARQQQGQMQQAAQKTAQLQQAAAEADVTVKVSKARLDQAKAEEIEQRIGFDAVAATQPPQPEPPDEDALLREALAEAS